MAYARYGAAAVVHQQRLYVCGGRVHRGTLIAAVECFDPSQNL